MSSSSIQVNCVHIALYRYQCISQSVQFTVGRMYFQLVVYREQFLGSYVKVVVRNKQFSGSSVQGQFFMNQSTGSNF